MKKSLITLLLGVFTMSLTFSQQQAITLDLDVQDSPCNGESFCVDVTVDDWTDIILLQSFLEWNPEVLRLDEIRNFNGTLTGLDIDDFNFDEQAEGRIFLDWSDIPCGSNGTILADGEAIFQMCFTAIGAYGDTTAISIPNVQIDGDFFPNVFKNNTCSFGINVGAVATGGVVSTCVRPVQVIASQEDGLEDDLVCVDFNVSGFDALRSMQFTVNWDPGQLQFESIIPNNDVRNLGPESFGLPTNPNIGAGNMTVSWSFANSTGEGITLDDGTLFFQVCYRIIGECETTAPISFSGNLTNVEVINTEREGVEILFLPVDGAVNIGDCDPTGLTLMANCGGPYNLNDEVCVTVSSDNFNNITELQHLVEWNPNILQFKEIRNINNSIFGLEIGSFNQANVVNGILGVEFNSPILFGSTLTPGGVGDIYDVCFDVIGLGGDSPFNFKGAPTMIARDSDSGSNNIGVNPSSCAVEVTQPEGVTLIIADGAARPGEVVCLDVTASNFNEIIEMDFSFGWESNVAVFNEIRNLQLPNAQVSQFGSGFSFEWSGDAITLNDGDVLFQLCLEMVGSPDDCDPEVGLVNLPIVPNVVNTTSNGEHIGLTAQNGEACVLFPEGFFLDIGTAEGDILDTICVPFKVANFADITQATFTVNWDPSRLMFSSVNNITTDLNNFDANSFDTNFSLVGFLDINWSDATGATLADSTTLFEVCYILLGPADECYEITVDDDFETTITTLNGDGDLVSDPGEICINDKLFVEGLVTNVTCPGGNDGQVELFVTGGRAPVGFNWELSPPQFGDVARNLSEGMVIVTVFDNSRPALVVRDTFMIEISGDQPTADAGEDQTLVCDGPIQSTLLSGIGSEGNNISYLWRAEEGGSFIGGRETRSVVAGSAGTYVFEVTDTNTGCVARDTTIVTGEDLPVANAGDDQVFTCESTTIRLNGSLSSTGQDISYEWFAIEGGRIVAGEENNQNPLVDLPGTYILNVKNAVECEVTDTVMVVDLTIAPPAEIGVNGTLGCEGSRVTLNPVTEGGLESYRWLTLAGEVLGTEPQLEVTTEGNYILEVTELNSTCVGFDTVTINRSIETPLISAEALEMITCDRDTVNLVASVSNVEDFTVEWSSLGAGMVLPRFVDSSSTLVQGGGLYQVVITNDANLCKDSITVTVGEDIALPDAEAGQDVTLNCSMSMVTLDGSLSSIGAGISYNWLRGDTITVSQAVTAEIAIPGIYYLEVTNNANGCSNRDSVTVVGDDELPQITFDAVGGVLDCNRETITLGATIQGTTDFEFEWAAIGDTTTIVSGEETLNPVVSEGGLYELRVMDQPSGCVSINQVEVQENRIPPFVNAGEDQSFNCSDTQVTLDGSVALGGNEGFNFQWTVIDGNANFLSTVDTVAVVDGPGTFLLTATSLETGCIGMDTVMVVADTTLPVVRYDEPQLLGCENETVIIDARESNVGSDFFVEWTGLDGNGDAIDRSISNNPLVVQVNAPGRYEVLIINNISLCEARDTVLITEVDEAPPIMFESDMVEENCLSPGVTLDARPTSIIGAFETTWVALNENNSITPDGENSLTATAVGIGDYELTLRNSAGCFTIDTVSVIPASGTPSAEIEGETISFSCGETAILDGSASTQGGDFFSFWNVVQGNGVVDDPTQLVVEVDQPGIYQLVITNLTNGCIDSSRVEVNLDTDGLVLADIGESNVSTCETSYMLVGNLPQGTTGSWTALDNGTISDPTQSAITAEGLESGINRFVWSLSLGTCENYSSDTLTVNVEATPGAIDDNVEVRINNLPIDLNLISNDIFSGVSDFTFEITSGPSLGELTDIGAGTLTYNSKGTAEPGSDVFQYLLCNEMCPNLCDEGSVTLTLLEAQVPNLDTLSVPNGITPNGDGLNDILFFDIIEEFPSAFDNNEIIIFNRWGDIVYEARPYTNDWDGTNESGQELPHGTYYYILRLDIPNGQIIRGDITIIR